MSFLQIFKRVANLPPVFNANLKSKYKVSSFFEFSYKILISSLVKNFSLALSIFSKLIYFEKSFFIKSFLNPCFISVFKKFKILLIDLSDNRSSLNFDLVFFNLFVNCKISFLSIVSKSRFLK